MNLYIYLTKKINIEEDEYANLVYSDVKPKLIAIVPTFDKEVLNELKGEYNKKIEELKSQNKDTSNVKDLIEETFYLKDKDVCFHYKDFNNETMMATDILFKEPKVEGGKLVEGYVPPKPQLIEPTPVEELTNSQKLGVLKSQLFDLQKTIITTERLGFGYDIIGLEEEKQVLIQQHKMLSELVAKGE